MLFVLLVVATVAPVVWIFVTLSAIRQNTARTVELLEWAQRQASSGPDPWEPDPVKWQFLAEHVNPRDEPT